MRGFAKLFATGNIGKITPGANNNSIMLSIAISRSVKNQNDEWTDRVSWFNFITYNEKLINQIQNKAEIGMSITVTAFAENIKRSDETGTKYFLNLNIETIVFHKKPNKDNTDNELDNKNLDDIDDVINDL